MSPSAPGKPREPIYSVHPSVAYAQKIIDNLPERTGRSMEEWVALVESEGPVGEEERRAWLKTEHGLGGTTAWMIAERSVGKGDEGTDAEAYLRIAPKYVDEMYAGPKAALRPIHDALVDIGRSLGEDVKVSPATTIVPLYRKHVFAEIKPSTQTRIDLGLALKKAEGSLPERLIDTGGAKKGDRITHRIPLASIEEVDEEVGKWMQVAYELDA